MQEATRKVILRLKEARAQKNLTYQDIVDACEAQNESVSLSTVRRIFSKGSEDGSDYRSYTINAIFRAVIGTEEIELTDAEEAALTDGEKEVFTENSALKAVVEMKDATIADLQRQIDELSAEKEKLEQNVSVMQIKLDTMLDVIRVSMEAIGKAKQ